MEFIIVLSVFMSTVMCLQVTTEEIENDITTTWITSIPETTTLPDEMFKDSNYTCEPYDPPLPDFRAPGRRISEVKCFEYKWQIEHQEEQQKREEQCLSQWEFRPPIVSGQLTTPGDYPNMGAIGWKAVIGTWKFMCGGTLISPKFVLTAAHCSYASKGDTTITDVVPKIVRLGATNILDIFFDSDFTIDMEIIKILVQPDYKSPRQYFDIGLMELKSEVNFSMFIQPACLWLQDNLTVINEKFSVTGWGVVESGSTHTSTNLQVATVEIVESVICSNLLLTSHNRNWWGLSEHQMCAGNLRGGADTCQGDSGGPLQVKLPIDVNTTESKTIYVIGVTSFGIGCGLPNLPGVYTRVSSFIDWIENIVWPEEFMDVANSTEPLDER